MIEAGKIDSPVIRLAELVFCQRLCINNNALALFQGIQGGPYQGRIYLHFLFKRSDKKAVRHKYIAAVRRLLQDIEHGPLHPERGIFRHAELLGYCIGCSKAYAADVHGQAVRIFLHFFQGLRTVDIVDADTVGRRDAVRLQELHQAADASVLAPALGNALEIFLPYAAYFEQLVRLLVQDAHGISAKFLHHALGHVPAHALDQA